MTRRIAPFDMVADVEDFHRKFGINYQGPPRIPSPELMRFRIKFMREEINEYEEHMDAAAFLLASNGSRDEITAELAEALDALVDLMYVTLGTAHLQGFNYIREAWSRVHNKNMQKIRPPGAPTNPEELVKMKIIKPPGWTPPDHRDLVKHHAHGDDS